jgi:hypothetical protein
VKWGGDWKRQGTLCACGFEKLASLANCLSSTGNHNLTWGIEINSLNDLSTLLAGESANFDHLLIIKSQDCSHATCADWHC